MSRLQAAIAAGAPVSARTLGQLSKVLTLREHRSAVARMKVHSTAQALAQAQEALAQQQAELRRREAALAQSRASAAEQSEKGCSGSRFEDFMTHARWTTQRIRDQEVDVAAARGHADQAQRRLERAQALHAQARRAEEKTRSFRQESRQVARIQEGVRSDEALEEATLLQRRGTAPGSPG